MAETLPLNKFWDQKFQMSSEETEDTGQKRNK